MKKEKLEKSLQKVKKTKSSKKIKISGLSNQSAKALFVLALFSYFNKNNLFWLVKNEKEKEEIMENLQYFQEEDKFDKKIKAFNLYSISGKLLFFLEKNNPSIFLGTIEDFNKEVPTKEKYQENIISLEKGQKLSPAKISQQLIKMGYQFDRFAAAPGFFSRQGSVVSIYTENYSYPQRIELSDQKIEKIQSFNAKNKKIIKKKSKIKIIPANLEFIKKEIKLHQYLRNLDNKKNILISSDPDEESNIFEKLKFLEKILFYTLEKEKYIKLDFSAPPYFHKNFKKAAEELRLRKKEKYHIVIATKNKKAIKEFFKRYNLKNINIKSLPSNKIEGFISPQNKVLFLTDKEIFGEQQDKNEFKRRKTSFDLIYELKPNDYVVHMDHGIGRFLGIVKRKINNHYKEYFSLAYAENDKLFVPVENADKITKYIGEARPKLHRLSSTSWLQTTNKIKKSAEKTARQLIKLYAARETAKAIPLKEYPPEEKELEISFEHKETPDQAKVISEVLEDLSKNKPTDRLICGDVGFGKTEVAVRAAYRAFLNHKQTALLCPTTLLTQQHYDTFKERLDKLGLKIALLSRVQTPSQQKEILTKLKTGLIDIIIGTHRLLSQDIKFKDLALIIIDEEQRFGVKDKERLKSFREEAHVLTLSATPIPRTLNFSLTGLRDISIIKTPPQGRKTVETHIIPFSEKTISQAIKKEMARKGQVYYLHNRVETIALKAKHIKKLIPKARIGIAHGQLIEKELMEAMKNFDNRKTDVLICSTIIENGLDLPNANTLIVENSTRFGLGDLYQLRGRIGRSEKKAYAYFLYNSRKLNSRARKRLGALLQAKQLGSGFQLALRDLQIRGSGNILGHKQSGHIKAIGLNLYVRLLNQAIEEAKTGKKQNVYRDVIIDLPLDISIPDYVISQQAKRLKVYQEMANFLSVKELEDYRRKFKKKYEQEPQEVKNLFAMLKLKITAQKVGITHISHSKINISGESKEKITLTFSHKINPDKLKNLLEKNKNWDFTEEQIKIEKNDLGEKWLSNLTKCVRVFT
ncbi:MAG: transcription-repair coupling factor [Patescibacteria group bacterium]|nr:transcription-repair coupling factor [Patescibacteria group bacterium]